MVDVRRRKQRSVMYRRATRKQRSEVGGLEENEGQERTDEVDKSLICEREGSE